MLHAIPRRGRRTLVTAKLIGSQRPLQIDHDPLRGCHTTLTTAGTLCSSSYATRRSAAPGNRRLACSCKHACYGAKSRLANRAAASSPSQEVLAMGPWGGWRIAAATLTATKHRRSDGSGASTKASTQLASEIVKDDRRGSLGCSESRTSSISRRRLVVLSTLLHI